MKRTETNAKNSSCDSGVFATLWNLFGRDGSSAPSGRVRVGLLVFAVSAATLLASAPAAFAGKIVDRVVAGGTSTGGAQGQFDDPRGIAVNYADVADGGTDPLGASTDGYVYVVDEDRMRVQVFGPDGSFRFMWGRGVENGGDGAQVCDASETPCTSVTTADDEEGEFDDPQGIAINQQTGHVYVRDRDNRRVQEFEADGTFVRAWGHDVAAEGSPDDTGTGFEVCTSLCKAGTAGGLGGQFASSSTGSTGIAVVPAGPANAGNVVVADPGNRRVQEFTSAGAFVRLWGWDVVATGQPGDIDENSFEICESMAPEVCKVAASAGSDPGRFANNSPAHLAVDDGGIVYALASTISSFVPIMRFDSTATEPADLVAPGNSENIVVGSPGGLGIDPISGNLFVGASRSDELGVSLIEVTDPAEAFVTTRYILAPESEIGTMLGVGLDPGSGTVYTAHAHRIFASDDDGASPATAMLLPPSEIGPHEATFNATVNPNDTAIPVSYRFQVSKNGVTWTDVAPFANLGTGTSPIPLEDTATGLEGNTFYRVRIVTRKAFGNAEVVSPELTFLTDAVGPEVQTLYPKTRTETGATLTAKINANNLPATYVFEYGETEDYGNKAPIPAGTTSGGTDKLIYAKVDGLNPDTTYHYRLVATNAEGTTKGEDVSFTTREPAPAAGDRAYEMITPPFKVVRGTGGPVLFPGNNPNPSVASLDGESASWTLHLFPLTDDVQAAMAGDKRLIRRTPDGWVASTRNTVPLVGDPEAEAPSFLGVHSIDASSGDFETITLSIFSGGAGLLPTEGSYPNRLYTRRDGTGVNGFTPWLDNPEEQVIEQGFSPSHYQGDSGTETAVLNDDGSAMARWGYYRGLAGPEDPSVDQLRGENGGRTPYLQRASDPDLMPTSPKELISECTGTTAGGDATQVPARIGTGASTDTIGVIDCEENDGEITTGTGDLASFSNTVTNVSTTTGTFSVGQLISGQGIPSGARITAVGPDTLTLSASAAPEASTFATLTAGSPTLQISFGSTEAFVVGKEISGAGIPPGTTLIAKTSNTLTLSQNATVSGEFVTVTQGAPGPGTSLEARFQHITSLRGATVGSGGPASLPNNGGTSATALSNDGSRVYFQAPDFHDTGAPATGCTSQTGFASDCVSQLFIRADGPGGERVVRWVSRSRTVPVGSENGYTGPMIAGQQVALMGNGVAFQGASRDGSVVYFKTNAPLTPDDPNGTGTPGPKTTGSASNNSWDLYRYELPADPEADPDEGVLTRISGGPDGTADPSTNTAGEDSPLRFHSDDGSRVYFVTTSPIPGAVNTPPKGGSTSPGGTVGNTQVRNLYLFDDNKTGAQRYRFIALLPYHRGDDSGGSPGTGTAALNGCASSKRGLSDQLGAWTEHAVVLGGSCFRGTADGRAVAFATAGQLTADDDDQAGDIYHYEADADELVRVNAPPPGAEPYACNIEGDGGNESVGAYCNAELGRHQGVETVRRGLGLAAPIGAWENSRGWGGMRYYNMARDEHGVVSVFFATKQALVDEDVNEHLDVYEWRAGEVSLVSPGNAPVNAWFAGNSTDGEDVFFQTGQRIDPREVDDADLDIYDARVGGGFAYTPPATPCDVLALECESEAISAPASRASATATYRGAGNVRPAAKGCRKNQARRGKRCVSKHALARRACAKRKGRAKKVCMRNKVRRLSRKHSRSQHRADIDRRASR